MRLLGRRSLNPALATVLGVSLLGAGAGAGAEPGSRGLDLAPVDAGLQERLVALPDAPAQKAWESEPFTMVGATWSGTAAHDHFSVLVSLRTGDRWTPWEALEEAEHGPTVGDGEGLARRGTDLRWVGPSDGVRVRTTGAVPRDLRLTLLDTSGVDAPATAPARATTAATAATVVATTATVATAASTTDHAPRPKIRGRKKWGANERWRDGDPVKRRHMKMVHVHHSVSSNDYRRRDVPGMIQGFYRYHTRSLGWSDLGYNYLVDRFGRAWKGRAGGWKVQGAHTLGFNHNSIGIAVIGDFRTEAPGRKVVRTVARISAWQLDKAGRRAKGKIDVISKGSDRYAEGKRVTLPAIAGHRRTNHTACPGEMLVKKLPQVRKRAQRRINRF